MLRPIGILEHSFTTLPPETACCFAGSAVRPLQLPSIAMFLDCPAAGEGVKLLPRCVQAAAGSINLQQR
jgi:hypothetical protein